MNIEEVHNEYNDSLEKDNSMISARQMLSKQLDDQKHTRQGTEISVTNLIGG